MTSLERAAGVKIVRVRWVDSSLQNVQVGRQDYPVPEEIESVGWLIESTAESLLLARDSHRGDDFRGMLAIPRCAVLSEETV